MPEFVRRGCCVGIKAKEHKHHHHHHHHHKERCENRCNPPTYLIYPAMPMSGCSMPGAPMQGPGAYPNPVNGANYMDWME